MCKRDRHTVAAFPAFHFFTHVFDDARHYLMTSTEKFDIIIQLGSILAVVVLFRERLLNLNALPLWKKTVAAVVPALFFGALFDDLEGVAARIATDRRWAHDLVELLQDSQ